MAIIVFHANFVFAEATSEIRFAYTSAGAPYCWEDNSGRMQGVFIDLLNEVFEKRMGIRTVHKGYPWSRAQRMVEKGEMDAFCTIATPIREKYADFCPTPILSSEVLIVTWKDNPGKSRILGLKSLDDLKGYRVITYRGNGFASTYKGGSITQVENSIKALQLVAINRYDVFFDLGLHVKYYSRIAGVENDIVGAPFAAYPVMKFRLGISRRSKWMSRIAEINNVIREIHEDGTYDAILSRYKQM
ncbi:substrate-binding periplasmic protein [Maridesulfovibrio sp. FT414]|uniref:substrate-binding periplasmic protein n=1 Tax=Maridesulfovibrio sp. FT414 TaxID=2979469 RepID=UPI003D801596